MSKSDPWVQTAIKYRTCRDSGRRRPMNSEKLIIFSAAMALSILSSAGGD
jgi:hypothetical protein